MSPARPGRSTLLVTRPGTGSRTDEERLTRMAGSLPSRRCGRAARMSRRADCSVPSMARSHSSSPSCPKEPAGGPPEFTTRRSRPPSWSTADRTDDDGPSGRLRSAATQEAPMADAAASSFSCVRPTSMTRAPSPASTVAMPAPRPEAPPPTSARLPLSPRSTSSLLVHALPRVRAPLTIAAAHRGSFPAERRRRIRAHSARRLRMAAGASRARSRMAVRSRGSFQRMNSSERSSRRTIQGRSRR